MSVDLSNVTTDRDRKERFASVDVLDILDRVAGLTIETWNYKNQDRSLRHMGPMAGDFSEVFGVGETDKRIEAVDALGVALAAIQGLVQMVKEQEERIVELEGAISARAVEEVHG